MTEKRKKLTISELADEFGIAPSAIRYYEEVGLLSPQRNSCRGQRLYGDRERARLKLILRGRRFGYSLSEIADILELYDAHPTQARQIMRTLEYGFRHIREMDERIEELLEIRREMLEFARSFLEILKEEGEDREARSFIALAEEVIRELEGREFGVQPLREERTPEGIPGAEREPERGRSGKAGKTKVPAGKPGTPGDLPGRGETTRREGANGRRRDVGTRAVPGSKETG
ncbi:MerR family transcriptional regulator [Candidatus Solincola sp.]|nr:MerR family transcriptional regulator [Actinomycetota bacterium]